MPYIGRDLNRGNYLKLDDISSSFNGSTTTFNLTVGGSAFTPGSAFSILVSVGGVIQEPESAYQVNNSEITFANAPTAQDSFFCIALGVALGIGVPGNGTVNGTQMAKPFSYDGFFHLDDSDNRVGIGSLTPTSTLDVIGNAKVSGILTATSFSGPTLNTSGISTFYNLRVSNNLTVEGTTTTLDTNLVGVDRVEVGANSNSIVGVAVTQSGTADIVQLFDGTSQVVTIDDTGNVGIGSTLPSSSVKLDVAGKGRFSDDLILLNGKILTLLNDANTANVKIDCDGGARLNIKSYDKSIIQAQENWGIRFFQGNETERFAIDSTGGIIVGAGGTMYIPDKIIHYGDNDTAIRFPSADKIQFETGGGNKLSIGSSITSTTAITIYNEQPELTFQDSNHSPYYYSFKGVGGALVLSDSVNGNRISFNATGSTSVSGGVVVVPSAQVSSNLGVTGSIIISDQIYHDGDTDTKIRFPAADTIRFETAGSTRFGLNSSGNVEIHGTQTGNNVATIYNGTGALSFYASSNSGVNRDFRFFSSNSNSNEALRIDSSGRVLIGTTTIGSASGDDLIIGTSGDTGMTIRSGNTSDSNIYFADTDSDVIGHIQYDHNNNSYKTFVNGTQAIHIDNDLKILLGKSSFGGMASGVVAYGNRGGLKKDSLLALNATASVSGRGAGVAVGGNTTAMGSFYAKKSGNADSDGGNVFLESIEDINFITGGDMTTAVSTTPQVIIKSGGNVGINSTAPTQKLDVYGNIRGNILYLDRHGSPGINITSTSDTGGGAIYFGSPASGVRGGILYDHNGDKLQLRNIYGNSIEITNDRTSTFFGNLQIPDKIIHSGDTNTSIRFPSNDTITFETAGTQKVSINSDGDVVINNTSPVAGKLEVNTGTEGNGATEYYGEDFAINIRANKGPNPNDEGNGICFTQQWYSSDAALIRAGAIVSYKVAGNGAFGGGLKFKVQQSGANPMRDIVRMRASMVEIPHNDIPLQFGAAGELRIRHSGTQHKFQGTNTDPFVFSNSNGELLRLSSNNVLLVGTTTEYTSLRAVFQGYSNGGENFQARIRFQTAQATNLTSGSHIANLLFTNASGSEGARIDVKADKNWATGSYPTRMSFSTTKENSNTPTERLRITELGDFYAGNAVEGGYAFFDNSSLRPRYQFVQGTGTHRGFAIVETRGDANGMDVFIGKSREGGGNGLINAGDQLGKINFAGADGTNMVNGAQIFAYTQSTATVAADRMPTNLSFRTHDNDTAGLKERIRIHHDGRVSMSKNGWAGSDASFGLTVHTGSTSETGPVPDGIMIVSQQNNGNQNSSTGKLMFCGHAQINGPFMYGDNINAYGKKDLVFHTRSTANDYTTQLGETIRFNYQGRVGIGTVNPDYTLDIGSSAPGSMNDGTYNTLRIRSNNGGTCIRLGAGGGGSRITMMRIDGESNGAHVFGDSDYQRYGISLVYHGDRSGNENSFAVYTDNSTAGSQLEAFNIRQNGDYMHGGSEYSDRDQKENITSISGTALDKITQLIPRTWNWKPEYHNIPTDRIFAGFIAQEVQQHIPSIVTGTDGQGDMALDYKGLLAWTIKGLTELKSENDSLKERLNTLEARISALEGS